MSGAVLTILLAATCGECRADDCHRCYKPCYSVCDSFHDFFCNLAPPCDRRFMHQPWPLEYPGARARGWQSHEVAATKHTPINFGPEALPVVPGPHGIPRVLGYLENQELSDPIQAPADVEPVSPASPSSNQGGAATKKPAERKISQAAMWRFVEKDGE